MLDQASELRNLVSKKGHDAAGQVGPQPRLLVFSGAKGGVGVTTLTINVAITMAGQGLRVVLVDADLYRADVAALCQLPERGHLGDILSARRDIHEVLERGPGGILVVPGVWAPDHEIPFSQHSQQRLMKQIQSLGRHADMVLIDVGSAPAEAVYRFWHAADEVVLVTTPDSVAVMDAYATLKTAVAGGAAAEGLRLIVNQAQSVAEGEDVHRRMDQSAHRFLQRQIAWLGTVVHDPQVSAAAHRAAPVVLAAPASAAAQAIQAIAVALATSRARSEKAAA